MIAKMLSEKSRALIIILCSACLLASTRVGRLQVPLYRLGGR